MARRGANFQADLNLESRWMGFDLVNIGAPPPKCYRRDELILVSGSITTVSPMKNQAGFDINIASVDPAFTPRMEASFLAPTMMSRYEGIHQCGTSCTLLPSGKVTINFTKNTNPLVLHLSGLSCLASSEDPVPIPLIKHEVKDWQGQGLKACKNGLSLDDDRAQVLTAEIGRPPALRRYGSLVFLEGELHTATYGPIAQRIGTLPEGYRPVREVRWLANLLKENGERVVEHSVAVTLRPDGGISVQGGKVHAVDAKGIIRVLQQKKKGRLFLDGIRFALTDGYPIEPSAHLGKDAKLTEKSKAGYTDGCRHDGNCSRSSAVCIKQADVVILEGCLTWTGPRAPNAKQPLGKLPAGCWPERREVFFVRGGNDHEERRRVDIDKFGRIFCPEGAGDGRIELTGVMFVATEPTNLLPRDPDSDELKLQYQRSDVDVVSTSFDGHELLEQFVRRVNYHEWQYVQYDLARHARRKVILPLGEAQIRGDRWDPMDLGKVDARLWLDVKGALDKMFNITSFHTLVHVSNQKFEEIANAVGMREDDKERLRARRRDFRKSWNTECQARLTYSYLQGVASEIVDQMFDHWDFKAQIQGALSNDFRAPLSIQHLFPRRPGYQERLIKENIDNSDMPKFEEIRQFFHLYETTGNTMTHCSLMGTGDVFTTTGKWHFPDAPDVQAKLFENIAWLFPRSMYLYMSERQTSRFPFIEDLDIQCRTDWQEWAQGEKMRPPDELIMKLPARNASNQVCGDPGEMMHRRAEAIHMIYPQIDQLQVVVYSASGYNKGKDMLKSSFHLVWPQLIVDADRAPVIRYVTLGKFQKETALAHSMLGKLQERLLELDDSNVWELVFDKTTINARNGLRLPYSDKASMVIADEDDKRKVKEGLLSKTKAFKKRVKEGRPSVAIGVIQFEFGKDLETGTDKLLSSKWVADKDSFSIAQWIAKGTCRRDPSNYPDLTQWCLGQEAIEMLKKTLKPGESFAFDEGAEGKDGVGQWVTHKPLPNVRRCCPPLSTRDFVSRFNDALVEEQEALRDEHQHDLLKQIVGSWTHVTAHQAVWKTTAMAQSEAKVIDFAWGSRRMQRPTEVVYFACKGKLIISGLDGPLKVMLSIVEDFTKPDDNAIMPIYDVTQME